MISHMKIPRYSLIQKTFCETSFNLFCAKVLTISWTKLINFPKNPSVQERTKLIITKTSKSNLLIYNLIINFLWTWLVWMALKNWIHYWNQAYESLDPWHYCRSSVIIRLPTNNIIVFSVTCFDLTNSQGSYDSRNVFLWFCWLLLFSVNFSATIQKANSLDISIHIICVAVDN